MLHVQHDLSIVFRAESATWLNGVKEYSQMNFEQLSLDPRLVAATKDAGYTTPTPIQEQAIPIALQGRDLLGLAMTGTGKTAAFLLPILNRLMRGKLGGVRALIVAPTRELAEQIHQAAIAYGRHTRVRSVAIYGGVSKINQVKALRRGAEIVVATPGRLLDHVRDGSISLSQVEVLVLDEADHMFDMGFLPDVRRIVNAVPKQRQTMLFSATMPPEIRGLADSVLTQPETIQIGQIAPAKTVAHALYPVPEMRKLDLLVAMLNQTETQRVLIFTRTKRRASDLAERLERHGHTVTALQGNMAQNARQKAINGFRNGEYKILVATDIAARGIDVPHISHVINYDMPDTVDAYTHRIGRTGRAHEVGEAFTYVQPMDEIAIRDVEKLLGSRIERRRLDGFDYGTFSPERQGLPAHGSQRKPVQHKDHSAPRARFNAPPEERGGYTRRRPAQPSRSARPQ